MATNELVYIKYGVGIGISFYVIKELFRLVFYLIKQKKVVPNEQHSKNKSRDRIKETNAAIIGMRDNFWEVKHKCDDIHEVVTEKAEGVPLVYNKGLEKGINALNNAIVALTTTIRSGK